MVVRLIRNILGNRVGVQRGKTYVFALPYLADYRRVVFDRLAELLDRELILVHPRTPFSLSTRVIEHNLSHFSEPVVRRFGLESQPRLVRTIIALRPAALVVEANTRDLTYVRLLLWARLAKVPVAIWGLGRYGRRRSVVEIVGGSIMTFVMVNLSSCVIGKGSGPAEFYRRYSIRPGKVVVAPNSSGIEEQLERLPYAELEHVSVTTPLRVLFVGRLTESKDIDVLIRAVSMVGRPQLCELHIVGEGSIEADLRSLARDLGIESNVHFYGNLQGNELVGRFRQAHVLALPGKGGLVVPEALAAGLPLVVGSLDHAGDGTLGELLQDGLNAFVAPEPGASGVSLALGAMMSAVDDGGFPGMQVAARDTFARHGGVAAMSAIFARFLTASQEAQARARG